MSTPAKFTITVRAQMSFDAYFQLYVKRIGFPAYTIDESAVLSRSQANEFTQSNNYIQQAQNIATALNADKGDAPISVTTQDNIVIIEALTDGCVIDIFKITGAWALSTTTEAIVETCDATVTVSQDSGDPVNNVMQQISIDTQFAYPLNLYCGGENNIINGHGIGYLIISATNQSELRCGIGRLTSDFTPREWVIRKVENNIVKMQSVVGAPTVSMFNIVSVTISNNGTSFTPNIEITNGDYGLYLEVAIVETTFCPLADHLSIVLTPNTDYLLYVRDQFGGILTFPFRSTWVPEVEPVPIVFADRDQQCEILVEAENPVSTNMLRINAYIRFTGLDKTIKKTLPATGASNATFDVNDTLWGELYNQLSTTSFANYTFPADTNNLIKKHPEMLQEFFIDHSYTYVNELGVVTESDVITGTDAYIAMYGGASRALNSWIKNQSKTLYSYTCGADLPKFLSWMPEEMVIHPKQPVRLWFLNNNRFTSVNLKVKTYYTDGGEAITHTKQTLASTIDLLEVCCGPEELDIYNDDISRTVLKYDVWLENDDASLATEVKTFVVDTTFNPRNQLLFFRTSLGVYETVWCKGKITENDEYDQSFNTRPLAPASIYRGTLEAERATIVKSFKINTGFIRKEMRHWLSDFLTAGQALLPYKFFMIPVLIKTTKMDYGNDDDDLFAVPFEVRVAHTETHFSQIPEIDSAWGEFNSDFNEDFNI